MNADDFIAYAFGTLMFSVSIMVWFFIAGLLMEFLKERKNGTNLDS